MSNPNIQSLATVAAAAKLLRSVGATYIISVDGIDVGDATDAEGVVRDAIAYHVNAAYVDGHRLGLEEGRKETGAADKTGGRRRARVPSDLDRANYAASIEARAVALKPGEHFDEPFNEGMFVTVNAQDAFIRKRLLKIDGRYFTMSRASAGSVNAKAIKILCRV